MIVYMPQEELSQDHFLPSGNSEMLTTEIAEATDNRIAIPAPHELATYIFYLLCNTLDLKTYRICIRQKSFEVAIFENDCGTGKYFPHMYSLENDFTKDFYYDRYNRLCSQYYPEYKMLTYEENLNKEEMTAMQNLTLSTTKTLQIFGVTNVDSKMNTILAKCEVLYELHLMNVHVKRNCLQLCMPFTLRSLAISDSTINITLLTKYFQMNPDLTELKLKNLQGEVDFGHDWAPYLTKLANLEINNCMEMVNFSKLDQLTELTHLALNISSSAFIKCISTIMPLIKLQALQLHCFMFNWEKISPYINLHIFPRLIALRIVNCSVKFQLFIDQLSLMTNIEQLSIENKLSELNLTPLLNRLVNIVQLELSMYDTHIGLWNVGKLPKLKDLTLRLHAKMYFKQSISDVLPEHGGLLMILKELAVRNQIKTLRLEIEHIFLDELMLEKLAQCTNLTNLILIAPLNSQLDTIKAFIHLNFRQLKSLGLSLRVQSFDNENICNAVRDMIYSLPNMKELIILNWPVDGTKLKSVTKLLPITLTLVPTKNLSRIRKIDAKIVI